METAESGISSARRAAGPWMVPLDKLRLKSSDPEMRRKGVEKLSGSDRPSDTELIFAHLHDENAQVRCAAVRALEKAKTDEALKSLMGALQDESFEVRESAARALGRGGDARATMALACCLRDPDAAVRIAVAAALRSLGWRPSTREELAWFEISVGNTPPPVCLDNVPAGSGIATNPDSIQDTSFLRRLAAVELKESTDPARILELRAALRGTNLLARISAVHDLGKIKDPVVTKELLGLFRHPDAETRPAVAQVLAAREDSPPAHFLSLLRDASAEVRLAAVQFLGRIRQDNIKYVLFPMLGDPDLQVRQAASAALR